MLTSPSSSPIVALFQTWRLGFIEINEIKICISDLQKVKQDKTMTVVFTMCVIVIVVGVSSPHYTEPSWIPLKGPTSPQKTPCGINRCKHVHPSSGLLPGSFRAGMSEGPRSLWKSVAYSQSWRKASWTMRKEQCANTHSLFLGKRSLIPPKWRREAPTVHSAWEVACSALSQSISLSRILQKQLRKEAWLARVRIGIPSQAWPGRQSRTHTCSLSQ